MKYKILVIDDQEYMHVVASKYLEEEFRVLKAKNVQQAIDILSEEPVHLILSDIHMPGMSGLEFLKSLRSDPERQQIPLLIMTQLPTEAKEREALSVGAADFISKDVFLNNKENVLKRIRMKLVSSVSLENIGKDLLKKKSDFTSHLLEAALSQNMDQVSQTLTAEIANQFEADYTSFWIIDDGEIHQISSAGALADSTLPAASLDTQEGFMRISDSREPYMSNNILNDQDGFYPQFSQEYNLPAEMSIPVFSTNISDMLVADKEVPADASLFGVIVIKRSELFSTEEFEILSRLVIQSGSIIWNIYNNEV